MFCISDYYVQMALLIWSKKMELCLTVVSVLLKIRFDHAQISVPKIGIPISKTACINPPACLFVGSSIKKIEL